MGIKAVYNARITNIPATSHWILLHISVGLRMLNLAGYKLRRDAKEHRISRQKIHCKLWKQNKINNKINIK